MASSELSKTFFVIVWKKFSPSFASTQIWELLHVLIVIKKLVDTRWTAHYEAVKALQHCFLDVVSTLNELCDQK